MPTKGVVLAVIDALAPGPLDRAVAAGRAPVLAELIKRGTYIPDCVSVFPSVTPVCAASIATGTWSSQHRIAGMNWYHRGEQRYIEYGSSFRASRAFGVRKTLIDTVYNLNLAHLSRSTPTLFETFDDAGLRTAGTTYLIYRGRYRHPAAKDSTLARMATTTVFRHGTYGPRELFYADLFSTRKTGCKSQLGAPGMRDQHTACVGAYLTERDLYDFMLFSLPDNDTHSHKYGPDAQIDSIEHADLQLAELAEAAGGVNSFFERYELIVVADHSQSKVERSLELTEVFDGIPAVKPGDESIGEAQLALCPNARAAQLYLLDESSRARQIDRLEHILTGVEGVNLWSYLDGDETVVKDGYRELRFRPGSELRDMRGNGWQLSGDLTLLDLEQSSGGISSTEYPNALERLWHATHTATAGDLFISAASGYEFTDWGGSDHVGGGSHGSLHREDSLAPLICSSASLCDAGSRDQWSIVDVAELVKTGLKQEL